DVCSSDLIPFFETQISNEHWRDIVSIGAASLLALPFLWAILFKKINVKAGDEAATSYYLNYSLTGISLHAIRFLVGIFLIGFFIDQLTTTRYALLVAVPIILALLWFFSEKVQQIHQRIAQQFISNLNERERLAYIQNKGATERQQKNEEAMHHFQEWNAYVTELETGDTFLFAGMTLYELSLKQRYGIAVVYIRRNERIIHLPNGKQRILPNDKIGVLGTEEQISGLKRLFDQSGTAAEEDDDI